MPSVLLEATNQEPKAVKICRPVTTIGSSEEVDIRVKDAGLEETHAQILMEGTEFTIVALLRDLTVNGRRERKKRLQDRDIIRFADLKLTFFERDEDVPKPKPKSRMQQAGEPAGVTVEKVSA